MAIKVIPAGFGLPNDLSTLLDSTSSDCSNEPDETK